MDKPPGSPSKAICAQNPESSSAPRKVGIITHSESEQEDNVYEVKIYIIDVDLDSCGIHEYTRVLPAVRFRFYTRCRPAICLLNSTVYIFGGYQSNCRKEPEAKSAHKFVLSPEVLTQPNYPVELGKKTQIAGISLMKFPKGTPAALPTPDGQKIIVFSLTICRKDTNRAFELYDPNGDYWEQLPPLPCRACNSQYGEFPCRLCIKDEILWVKTYSFLDESHFIIEFEIEMGAFALDLNNRAWTALRIKTPHPRRNPWVSSFRGYFVSVKGRYALSPRSAFDLGDNGFFAEDVYERNCFGYPYRVPLSKFARSNVPPEEDEDEDELLLRLAHEEEEEEEPRLRCIVPLHPVLENDGQVCNTCVLQLETYGLASEGRVLIDVCRTELTTLNTTLSNSLRLRIDFLDGMYDISLVSV